MFGLFGSNTPRYVGQAHAATPPRQGMFGNLLAGLFPTTPVYSRRSPAPALNQSSATGELPPIPVASALAPTTVPAAIETGSAEPQARKLTIIVSPGPETRVEDVEAFLRDRCGIHDA